MDTRNVLFYSIFLMIICNIIGLFSYEAVACGIGCWGGTTYVGFPLKWYQWGSGDIITGDEWLRGSINWINLIVDLLFWFIISFTIIFAYFRIRNK